MSRGPRRGGVLHTVLALILAGVAWHLWRGGSGGPALAVVALAAHGGAVALGYWWLRRRFGRTVPRSGPDRREPGRRGPHRRCPGGQRVRRAGPAGSTGGRRRT
ncbi:hypothetical protein [Streptomyces sp. NPDC014894]|uniref:hypothetical protein n=1 Tax=Streptomyces sp. NPDC014894 TaxID=3364931 RepID=UPI0036FA2743